MADPMTREDGRGLDDDDSNEEKIGGPGNPPPKPWYQRISAEALATGILFIVFGLAIGVGIIVTNIDAQGPVPQNPQLNPQDAVRPPLAGGSSDAIDPGSDGPSGSD